MLIKAMLVAISIIGAATAAHADGLSALYGNWDAGGGVGRACQGWFEFRPGSFRLMNDQARILGVDRTIRRRAASYQLSGKILTLTYATSTGPIVMHWQVIDPDTIARKVYNFTGTGMHLEYEHRCK